MEAYEKKRLLDSFEILVDTREQQTQRLENRCGDFGCGYQRATLDYGDYAYNIKLPGGMSLHDTADRVSAFAVVERKMNLDELAICLTSQRERFVRELERARENQARVYLLVENGDWDMIIAGKYKSWMRPKAYAASLSTFMARYTLQIVFVSDYNSGILIKDILFHDCRERLERGDFG